MPIREPTIANPNKPRLGTWHISTSLEVANCLWPIAPGDRWLPVGFHGLMPRDAPPRSWKRQFVWPRRVPYFKGSHRDAVRCCAHGQRCSRYHRFLKGCIFFCVVSPSIVRWWKGGQLWASDREVGHVQGPVPNNDCRCRCLKSTISAPKIGILPRKLWDFYMQAFGVYFSKKIGYPQHTNLQLPQWFAHSDIVSNKWQFGDLEPLETNGWASELVSITCDVWSKMNQISCQTNRFKLSLLAFRFIFVGGTSQQEAQLHGEIDLDKHVDSLVVHERHRPSAWIVATCSCGCCMLQWL